MARILVVEDDADILALVTHKLRQAGHEVTSEIDGQAGLASARATRPDLIVMDWMMPRLSGLEVCEEIRRDTSIAHTRILMLTAKAQEIDIERAFAAGADEYILKPFSSRELIVRVNSLLTKG